jgi:hypothetical protein
MLSKRKNRFLVLWCCGRRSPVLPDVLGPVRFPQLMVIARGSWGRSFRRQQGAGSLLASPKPTFAQVDTEVAALLAKRKALTAGLVVAEDTVACLRRQDMALSETLITFRHQEPERRKMPTVVKHTRSKEGFRMGAAESRALQGPYRFSPTTAPLHHARQPEFSRSRDQAGVGAR